MVVGANSLLRSNKTSIANLTHSLGGAASLGLLSGMSPGDNQGLYSPLLPAAVVSHVCQ